MAPVLGAFVQNLTGAYITQELSGQVALRLSTRVLENRMLLYHLTTKRNAEKIEAGGLIDGTGSYMLTREGSGLWYLDSVREFDARPEVDTVLTFSIPAGVAVQYEWEDEVKPYREFLIPASVVVQFLPPESVTNKCEHY